MALSAEGGSPIAPPARDSQARGFVFPTNVWPPNGSTQQTSFYSGGEPRIFLVGLLVILQQRLETRLPNTPVMPIRLKGSEGYSMFEDLQTRYDKWVMPIYEYENAPTLIASLEHNVIGPAQAKAENVLPGWPNHDLRVLGVAESGRNP